MIATVKQVSPLLIREDGTTVDVRALRLTSYTPVVNDRVFVEQIDGKKLLVHGKPV